MEKILSPKSIAIVGVSNDLQKVGSVLLRNLLEGGYNGKVYPINPKYTELQGRQVFPNILAVNDDITEQVFSVDIRFDYFKIVENPVLPTLEV